MPTKLFIWHRRIGICAVLFLVFLVVTGIVLQHSDGLSLPSKFLTNTWLLRYYGIKPNRITTYQLMDHTVSHAGETIYLSGKPVDFPVDVLHGAVTLNDQIVIATSDSIVVCDRDGELIDEITMLDGLSDAPLAIALTGERSLAIRGAAGYWKADSSFTEWHAFDGSQLTWAMPSSTLPALRKIIESQDMGRQINLERFLLDMHSGRFFGRYGVYVVDAAAILLLILAATGIGLWVLRR